MTGEEWARGVEEYHRKTGYLSIYPEIQKWTREANERWFNSLPQAEQEKQEQNLKAVLERESLNDALNRRGN